MIPNTAFLITLVGLLGVYCEFVRPGRVFPGLAGSVLAIGGIYDLTRHPLSRGGLILVGLALALFGLEAFWRVDFVGGLLATASLSAGSSLLLSGPERLRPALAISASILFGGITVLLCYGAKRARRNKWSDIAEPQEGRNFSER